MQCPNCGEETTFSLIETADDYQDGIVECNNCGKTIATFNLSVIVEENKEIENEGEG